MIDASPQGADRAGLLGEDAVDKNFPFPPFRHRNHNVVVTWLECIIQGSADSIWSNTVLASYMYELMSFTKTPNAYAGYVEAAQGLSNLIVALPIGWAADKYSKSRIVAFGGLLMPLAVASTSYAVIRGVAADKSKDDDERYTCFVIFLVSLCAWGVVSAIASGPAQALYAESVAQGERSKYYTILFSLYLLASTLGPILTIFMFWLRGNGWTLLELRDVFLVGLALELGAAACLLCFRDSCTLEPSPARAKLAEAAAAADGEAPPPPPPPADGDGAAPPGAPAAAPRVRGQAAIPYVLFASSLCFALGSGMTVKFFPLFFKNTCKMSPIGVQAIYVGVPLLMTLFSGAGTALARRVGRVQTMVALKVAGIGLLVGMAFLKDVVVGADGERPADPALLALLVLVYLLRSALMNCTYPLEESILMDFVPPDTRARWKSLDSVSVFGWCGSAALGGYLADLHGYTFTFLVTAAIQALATLLQASLMLVVPRSEAPAQSAEPVPPTVAPADVAPDAPRTPTRAAEPGDRPSPSPTTPGIQ